MTSGRLSPEGDAPGTDRHEVTGGQAEDGPAGGEPACWAHLVCAECGAMTGGEHRPGCRSGPAAPAAG